MPFWKKYIVAHFEADNEYVAIKSDSGKLKINPRGGSDKIQAKFGSEWFHGKVVCESGKKCLSRYSHPLSIPPSTNPSQKVSGGDEDERGEGGTAPPSLHRLREGGREGGREGIVNVKWRWRSGRGRKREREGERDPACV